MLYLLLLSTYAGAGMLGFTLARRKGYDDNWLLLLLILAGPVALIPMLIAPARVLRIGTVVRTVAPIALDDGRRIPRGHVSVVRAVTLIDDVVVCRITDPSRGAHWVAQQSLGRVAGARLRSDRVELGD